MAFQIITLPELVNRARQAFRNELPGTDAFMWPNNVNVSAKVMAGMTHLNLLWLSYIAKQRWASTADGEFLDKHGFVYGIARIPATFAQGKVTLTGLPGITVPAGVELSTAAGIDYVVAEAGIVSGLGSVELRVTAKEAGFAGNAVAGTTISLSAAFSGLNVDGVVGTDGIGLGADEEADEPYRARLLWRLRMPPMGGAAHDYVAWVRSVSAGISRVYVDPLADGPGTVTVYFLMDDIYTNGIPQGADVDAVTAYLEEVKPATAVVTVLAPTPVEVDFTIGDLSPDTTAVRDAITAELADLFRREVGVSTVQQPFTLYRSKLWQAIANATGEDHHVLAAPATDVLYAEGELPVIGTIAYV